MTVDSIRISFPWPPAALTPHAKGSPWPKINATKKYRFEAKVLAQMAKVPTAPEARLIFTFHPPRRSGDPHNVPGRCKALIDGIADAMGCDDQRFRCVWPETFADPVKGGAVVVEVQSAWTRQQPPVRRPHVTVDVEWQGHPFSVSIGLDPATGQPVDVFADRPKIDGMSATLSDACIVISLAMQCGLAPADLAKSLGEVPLPGAPKGTMVPASPLGSIVRAILAEVR